MNFNKINFAATGIIFLLLFSSCKIENVQYRRYENLKADPLSAIPSLNLDVIFYNPNSIGCRVSALQCFVITGQDTFASAYSASTIRLKAFNEFKVPLSSFISQAAILKLAAGSLLSGEDIPLDLSGDLTIQKFIFKKKFHFQVKEKFNRSMLFN